MLWHFWLGIRESTWPVKIEWWGIGEVISLKRGADCLHLVQLMPLHPQTPSSLASSIWYTFWYRHIPVVVAAWNLSLFHATILINLFTYLTLLKADALFSYTSRKERRLLNYDRQQSDPPLLHLFPARDRRQPFLQPLSPTWFPLSWHVVHWPRPPATR